METQFSDAPEHFSTRVAESLKLKTPKMNILNFLLPVAAVFFFTACQTKNVESKSRKDEFHESKSSTSGGTSSTSPRSLETSEKSGTPGTRPSEIKNLENATPVLQKAG